MRAGKKRAEIVNQNACKAVVSEAVGISRFHHGRTGMLGAKDAELKVLIEQMREQIQNIE